MLGTNRIRFAFWIFNQATLKTGEGVVDVLGGSTRPPLQGSHTHPLLSKAHKLSPSVGIAHSPGELPYPRADPLPERTHGHNLLMWRYKGPATLSQSGTTSASKVPKGLAEASIVTMFLVTSPST